MSDAAFFGLAHGDQFTVRRLSRKHHPANERPSASFADQSDFFQYASLIRLGHPPNKTS